MHDFPTRPVLAALALCFTLTSGTADAVVSGDALASALGQALTSEQQAQREYQAVLTRHGESAPFGHILTAERRHEAELRLLFDAHRLPVPPRTGSQPALAPETLTGACNEAVSAELEGIATYGRLLNTDLPADVRATFTRLRAASEERHLPAFRRCATLPTPRVSRPAPEEPSEPGNYGRYWSHGQRGHGLGWGTRCRQRARGWTN